MSVFEDRDRRSLYRRKRHPLLSPANQWTWKFLPGVMVGMLLHWWIAAVQRPAKKPLAAPQKQPQRAHSGADDVADNTVAQQPREELKMVLCVNDELKMGKGKIAAQAAHGAVGVVQQFQKKNGILFKQWESSGQPKIALRVSSTAELKALYAEAKARGLLAYAVHDAGRTQIAAGSLTVVAIGPAPKSTLDALTGQLKLL